MKPANEYSFKREALIFAFLSVVATVTLLIVSPDSYLHDLFDRVDSAWYYICGKAWANGMTPYVDFTDSKGPLLWIIYAVGYVLSPRDYTGVYWLTCLNFAITLYVIYRCAMLLLNNRRLSVICAVVMLLAYFYPIIHIEVKTEDFAQPFIALCLYGTLRLRVSSQYSSRLAWRWLAVMGMCIGYVLMMKYSFVPMLGIFVMFSLWELWCRRLSVWCGIAAVLGGLLLALLPWAIYFAVAGNFSAFVQEYFLNTLATLGNLREQHGSWIDLLLKLRLQRVITLFPLLCWLGVALHCLAYRATRWIAVITTLWFFALTLPNAWWVYYYVICTWVLFFGVVAVAKWLGKVHCRFPRLAFASVTIAVIAATGVLNVGFAPNNFCLNHHRAQDTYYRYAYLMGQVKNPRVIYWDCYATGFETLAHGLPACKYWSGQNGATLQMHKAQTLAVANGEADFVMVMDTIHDMDLQRWGYHKWDYSSRDSIDGCDDLLFTLYTMHDLQAPPEDFAPPTPAQIVRKNWHGINVNDKNSVPQEKK